MWSPQERKKEERIFLYFYHWLSFPLPCGIHLFPVASSPSLFMSLSVTSPSLLPPLFLSVYLIPRGSVVLFFCRSSGHKAKESPRQPSVYKAFCHVNKDKLFLSLTSQIPNSNNAVHPFHLKASLHLYNQCPLPPHLCVYTSVCVCVSAYIRMCVSVDGLAESLASSPE